MIDIVERVKSASDADAFLVMMELAAQGAGAIGPALELIKDVHPEIRSRGYGVLENIEGAIVANQEFLIECLNDLELGNSKQLTKVLCYEGVDPQEIMRKCRSLAKSATPRDIAASAYVAVSLGEIEESCRATCLDVIKEVCANPIVEVRRHGYGSMEEAHAMLPGLVPEIVTGVSDPDPEVRLRAATAAGQAGAKAKAAVPGLIASLKASDLELRSAAAWSLGHVGKSAAAGLEDLVGLLNDEDFGVRINAADAIGSLGKEASVIIPQIINSLGNLEKVTDVLVITAYEVVDDPKRLLDPLITILTKGPQDVRPVAAEHLGKLKALATKALPSLERALEDDDPGLRYVAESAITKISRA